MRLLSKGELKQRLEKAKEELQRARADGDVANAKHWSIVVEHTEEWLLSGRRSPASSTSTASNATPRQAHIGPAHEDDDLDAQLAKAFGISISRARALRRVTMVRSDGIPIDEAGNVVDIPK